MLQNNMIRVSANRNYRQAGLLQYFEIYVRLQNAVHLPDVPAAPYMPSDERKSVEFT